MFNHQNENRNYRGRFAEILFIVDGRLSNLTLLTCICVPLTEHKDQVILKV